MDHLGVVSSAALLGLKVRPPIAPATSYLLIVDHSIYDGIPESSGVLPHSCQADCFNGLDSNLMIRKASERRRLGVGCWSRFLYIN